jgi:hypothetical protein
MIDNLELPRRRPYLAVRAFNQSASIAYCESKAGTLETAFRETKSRRRVERIGDGWA